MGRRPAGAGAGAGTRVASFSRKLRRRRVRVTGPRGQGAMMATIRGVLLDIDGTLVDSNDAHARSYVEALAEHGIRILYEEARKRIGKGGDKLLPEVSGIKADTLEGRQITRLHLEIFNEKYLPQLRPAPG